MRRAVLPLIVALAGCQIEEQEVRARDRGSEAIAAAVAASAPAPAAAPMVALDAGGLRLVFESGASRLLAFGTSRDQAEQAIGATTAHEPERSEIAECGAGPMEFTAFGPLELNFHDGVFAGWYIDGRPGPSTIDGIAVGSAASQVSDARTVTMIPDSTLGHEFVLGERPDQAIGGFFDSAGPGATVTRLFAGINCFFR